jgi:hypothetical protein
VIRAEEREGVLDGVAAFDGEKGGEASCGFGGEDVAGGEAELHLGVAAELLVDGVDEGEGAMGEAAFPLGWLDPDGEELSGEVSGAGGGEVEVAATEFGGEVPLLVGETLGCVGVGVEDEGCAVDLFGIRELGRQNLFPW